MACCSWYQTKWWEAHETCIARTTVSTSETFSSRPVSVADSLNPRLCCSPWVELTVGLAWAILVPGAPTQYVDSIKFACIGTMWSMAALWRVACHGGLCKTVGKVTLRWYCSAGAAVLAQAKLHSI
jgi:hypothetical protein